MKTTRHINRKYYGECLLLVQVYGLSMNFATSLGLSKSVFMPS